MTSEYLKQPPRTKRQAALDRLHGNLSTDGAYVDGDIKSTRRLLEEAINAASRHADSLPMSEDAYDNATALVEFLNEALIDYLLPAEQSAKESFELEDVG